MPDSCPACSASPTATPTGPSTPEGPFPRGPQTPSPHAGRPHLGYDRLHVLMDTHFGEQKVPLQLITAKTRHKNPRSAMRCTRPGDEAVAKITGILVPRRTH